LTIFLEVLPKSKLFAEVSDCYVGLLDMSGVLVAGFYGVDDFQDDTSIVVASIRGMFNSQIFNEKVPGNRILGSVWNV
jgi:hypothetical protein